MWQLIDIHRTQARDRELRLCRSVIDAKLRQERFKHWKGGPNYETFKSLGGQVGRTMLYSWLFDKCSSNHLKPSTAFLAVNYLDRMLSRTYTSPMNAQSIASTCIRLAVKIDDVGGDSMIVPLFKDSLTLHSELFVLSSLEWQMDVPTVHLFIRMFAELVWLPPASREQAVEYAKHISLYFDCQEYNPSSLALVCILLLEQDSLLPLPCKALALGIARDGKVNAEELSEGFKRFRHVCFSSNGAEHNDDHYQRNGVDSSSTTAYPDSSSTQSSVCAP
ncbi:unnamed protein product [Agarophyton chilense]